MDDTPYIVKTESFEGPLELLLSLVEKRKMHISDVSLASVADDFIQYVESHEGFPADQIADFLLVASTLLLIKSKSLLPTLNLTEDEEENIDDLEKRLRLYEKIQEGATLVQKRFGKSISFAREYTPEKDVVFSPHKAITLDSLHEVALRVIASVPKKERLPETKVEKIMSIEEMVDSLAGRIQRSINLSFSEFSGMGREEKVTVIVGFLAMLELVKQGVINARQEGTFSDIMMESETIDTPRYT